MNHLWHYRNTRFPITGKRRVTEGILKKFLVRQPTGKLHRLHPEAKRIFNRMVTKLEPLKYKLKPLPQDDITGEIPLGGTAELPFNVKRTYQNNLPVYAEYRCDPFYKKTIIRHVEGDIDEFSRELSKIVSNSEITLKTGKIVVNGIHTEKVKLWLRRLGF